MVFVEEGQSLCESFVELVFAVFGEMQEGVHLGKVIMLSESASPKSVLSGSEISIDVRNSSPRPRWWRTRDCSLKTYWWTKRSGGFRSEFFKWEILRARSLGPGVWVGSRIRLRG